jgi:EAL domain-containing protein (putative c-di-GMP-specific phosphodiesterase class I)
MSDLRSPHCGGVPDRPGPPTTLGVVSPGEFVPVIEHSMHAHTMTDWILRAATGQLRSWQNDGMELRLSVNVSVSNLEDPLSVGRVLTIIADEGVRPKAWSWRSRRAP